MNALMMKIAARNIIGLNTNTQDDPDEDDLRRESERRSSPNKRALKSYGGKMMLGNMLAPGFGGALGLAHAHIQNTGAKERTRHLSDRELEEAHRNARDKKKYG